LNYLAHAYLSFNDPEILVGNLISDFVKGKKKFDYSKEIQKGISLHRSIDQFTDKHPVTLEAKLLFKPAYGLYASAFMDVTYDHFLATDKNEFPDELSLASFSKKTYGQLTPFNAVFPEKFKRMFHYMQPQDWLYNYRLKPGIYNSYWGMVHRASFIHEHESACKVLDEHYSELGNFYNAFFPDLKNFSYTTFLNLIEQ
jgi:acyl carrier protein phosphodiesterase